MRRVLYVTNLTNPFTQIDLEILQARYEVRELILHQRHPGILLDLWRATRDVDTVVAWFVSWHSIPAFVLAAVRGLPRLLISGGYDIANEPDINYGLRRGGVAKLLSDIGFRLASHSLMLSDYSYREALRNTPLRPNKMSVAYLGVPDRSEYLQPSPKEPIALCVAAVDAVTAWRKGVQPFVEAARYLPDTQFIMVGKSRDGYIDTLKAMASPNVTFTGFLSDVDLMVLRQRAKVYVQVSRHEGFGLAVAEAMLARCVPVVSRYGALPEVVGKTGRFVETITPQAVADAIQIAMQTDAAHGEAARQHILDEFRVADRAQALYTHLDSLM